MPDHPARFEDVAVLHRRLADVDAPDPAPHLVGFDGDQALVLIRLRPFAPGAYQGPLVEAMALVLPLRADRVSLAIPGRAWSLEDPLPPVADGVDLRQRVLTQVSVDGHGQDPPRVTTRLHPFQPRPADDPGCRLAWEESVDPGPGEGWIPDALATLVAARRDIARDGRPDERLRQWDRLEDLGHVVLLTATGRQRVWSIESD